jgi:hypothetical protein
MLAGGEMAGQNVPHTGPEESAQNGVGKVGIIDICKGIESTRTDFHTDYIF